MRRTLGRIVTIVLAVLAASLVVASAASARAFQPEAEPPAEQIPAEEVPVEVVEDRPAESINEVPAAQAETVYESAAPYSSEVRFGATESMAVNINVAALRAELETGAFTLPLPAGGAVVIDGGAFTGSSAAEGTEHWQRTAPGSLTSITLTDHGIFGFVTIDGRRLDILALTPDIHLLYEDGRTFEPVVPADPPVPANLPEGMTVEESPYLLRGATADAHVAGLSAADSFEVMLNRALQVTPKIKVLVLVDQSVITAWGGSGPALAKASASINAVNATWTGAGIQAELVAAVVEINYTSTTIADDAIDRLGSPYDGYIDYVHAMRENHNADFVTLYATMTDACGIANLPGGELAPSTDSRVFSVNSYNCIDLPDIHVIAHEFGHNLGSAHDEANAGSGGTYPYSFGWPDPVNDFRTIMSYANSLNGCASACPRIPQYSSATDTYMGHPTGDAGHDNKRSINNGVVAAAGYRPDTCPNPLHDFLGAAVVLGSSLPSTSIGDTECATAEPNEARYTSQVPVNSLWYSWTAPSNLAVSVTTCHPSTVIDTRLNIWSGPHNGTPGDLTFVATDDDDSDCQFGTTMSTVELAPTTGTTYHFQVDGDGAERGVVRIVVREVERPDNDDLSSPEVLPAGETTFSQTTDGASSQVGEPAGSCWFAGNPVETSVWFAWTATATGAVRVDTAGSSYDTDLTIYDTSAGTAFADLVEIGCGADEGGPPDYLAAGQALVTQGQTYYFQVDGYNSATGTLQLAVTTPPTCNGQLVTVDIGAGQNGTFEADVILGTAGPDVITGLGGDDVICALGGDDQIDAGSGDDLVFGAAGNDVINGGPGNDTLYGAAGLDTMHGDEDNDMLYGQSGADMLYGDDGFDTIDGSFGNDLIYGGEGSDTILGGSGADTVFGGRGGDNIDGGLGNDELNGAAGNDVLVGGDGDDQLLGQANNDTLIGGPGNDVMIGSTGVDSLYGGTGEDTLNAGAGSDFINAGPDNDQVIAGSGDDVINGGTGDDVLRGFGGSDTINGDDGADTLIGGGGADAMNGGAGADVLVGGGGADTMYGGSGADAITGNGDADNIYGEQGNDTLIGSGGADFIRGGNNNDTINGGPDDDRLYGDSGNDIINGAGGDDDLRGGIGTNTLDGGGGTDSCLVGSAGTTIRCE